MKRTDKRAILHLPVGKSLCRCIYEDASDNQYIKLQKEYVSLRELSARQIEIYDVFQEQHFRGGGIETHGCIEIDHKFYSPDEIYRRKVITIDMTK